MVNVPATQPYDNTNIKAFLAESLREAMVNARSIHHPGTGFAAQASEMGKRGPKEEQ